MTLEELKGLEVDDRVCWVDGEPGDNGTVTSKDSTKIEFTWDDGIVSHLEFAQAEQRPEVFLRFIERG